MLFTDSGGGGGGTSVDSPRQGSDDITYSSSDGSANNQSFQLSLQLALTERDNSLREAAKLEEEKEELLEKMEQIRLERDRALESLNGEISDRNLNG